MNNELIENLKEYFNSYEEAVRMHERWKQKKKKVSKLCSFL